MRPRVVIAATSVLLIVLVVGLAVAVSSDDDPRRADRRAPASSTISETTASSRPVSAILPAPNEIPASSITEHDIGALTTAAVGQWISAGGGAVWAYTDDAVVRVDAGSGAMNPAEFVGLGLSAVDGGVWSVDRCPKLLQFLTPDATVLQEFEVPLTPCGPYEPYPVLASSADAVWVLGGSSLFHVDRVAGTVDVIGLPAGPRATRDGDQSPGFLAADADGVWIAYRDKIRHVSATSNQIDAELSLGEHFVALSLALDRGALWATAVDVSSTSRTTPKAVRFDGGSSPSLEVPGVAWVSSSGGTVWFVGYWPDGLRLRRETTDPVEPLRVGQLDPRTGRVTRSTTFTLDPTKPFDGYGHFAAGDSALWLHLGSTLYRIPSA